MVLSMGNLAPYEEWELALNFKAIFLLTNSIMVRIEFNLIDIYK